MLKAVASALNGLVKRGRGDLSAPALELLETNRAKVLLAQNQIDPSVEAKAEADAEDDEQSKLDALRGTTGIYAFSYGWYLETPVDPDGENTLIKVGRSQDVVERIEQHRRGARAHIPEPLVTVRVYATGAHDVVAVERSFQGLLQAAGHYKPRRVPTRRGAPNEVGEEWYLTNRDFLDEIAKALKLRTMYSE